MTVNSRLVRSEELGGFAVVNPPGGVSVAPTPAGALTDGAGNLLLVIDNGDGTATLATKKVGETVAAAVNTVALTGSDQAVSATSLDYRGFSIRETAGATAVVAIYDNASAASGTIIEEISLAPGESAREFYPGGGIHTANGIYVKIVSGAVAGSVRTG